ncbi:macrophage scavenger receptor types I and II-like [Dysidea avara]|uniref:macrophage scavenger receptor types I and II-like n=1 Tax=Dysidea avara TaxID=196820 RepID=UPI003324955F
MKVVRLTFFTLVVITSPTFASYGDLRIYGGGDSGRLEFRLDNGTWGTVCNEGFDDDAGDVACIQLGYRQSSDVFLSQQFAPTGNPVVICDTLCVGDEGRLTDCILDSCNSFDQCNHSDDVGVTCTDSLTTGQVVGIVLGGVVFVILAIVIITVIVFLYCRRR